MRIIYSTSIIIKQRDTYREILIQFNITEPIHYHENWKLKIIKLKLKSLITKDYPEVVFEKRFWTEVAAVHF